MSGFTFVLSAEASTNYSIVKFIKKKVFRLIIPAIFVKYILLTPVKYAIDFYGIGYQHNFLLLSIRNTDIGHLWYLAILFAYDVGIFIIWRRIEAIHCHFTCVTTNRILYILILLSAIISVYLSKLPYADISIFELFYTYIFYFLFGILIASKRKELTSLLHRRGNNFMVITLIAGLIALHVMLLFFNQKNSDSVLLYRIIGLLGSIALLLIAHNGGRSLQGYKIISRITRDSMAIYLLHLPIQYVVIAVLTQFTHVTFIVVVIAFIISFIGSMGLARLIRQLHAGWVIGEAC